MSVVTLGEPASDGYRQTTMTTTQTRPTRRSERATRLATLLVAALALGPALAACGSDTDDGPSARPSATPTPTTTPTTDGPVTFTEVATFTDTRIRADETGKLDPLRTSADVSAWLQPLNAPAPLVQEVQEEVERHDDELLGTVLWVGCDEPESYSVVRTDGELEVRVSPPKQESQCVAPMTWLALVSVN